MKGKTISRGVLGFVGFVGALSCGGAQGGVAPPSNGSGNPGGASKASSAMAPKAPLEARFLELPPSADRPQEVLGTDPCGLVVVASLKGQVVVDGEALEEGDTWVGRGKGRVAVGGKGLAVAATTRGGEGGTLESPCVPSSVASSVYIARASTTPWLTWAGGKMGARLDVPAAAVPELYAGRLRGESPVAPHRHEGSWEVLCAMEGSGTFHMGETTGRLAPRSVVLVPPGVLHSFQPDVGRPLEAVQFYIPPGPEQRFVGLAQKEAGVPSKP